ncbi:protein dead ringer homolog [Asterias rubens]|uniref:protein dead ringer homolog n=1 Tax=Asterias rubens TaxID=7604 RepID=UPI00145542D5|nr:protein dead ringer homolog [Asterias rubens]
MERSITAEVLEQGRSNGVATQARMFPPRHHPFYSQAMMSALSLDHARRQEIFRRLEMMNGLDGYDSDEMDGDQIREDDDDDEEATQVRGSREIDLSMGHRSKIRLCPHPVFTPRHRKTTPPPLNNGSPSRYEPRSNDERRNSLSPVSMVRDLSSRSENSTEKPSATSPVRSTSERCNSEGYAFERRSLSSDEELNSGSNNLPEDYSMKLEKPTKEGSMFSEDESEFPQETKPPVSPSLFKESTKLERGGQSEWTFEEQFKQLYELSEDPKRKDFLDELFLFMQKRGTPVNRIPIMAKQVLDLYELFNLVTSKGGLVEVINKKQWREITKGLNLPASITSAAFTLRTQYMKYLYPYECEKRQLSTPSELQSAIDGNRREGRRQVYNNTNAAFGLSPHSPPLPTMIPHPSVIPLGSRESPEFDDERDARDMQYPRAFIQPRLSKHPMKHSLYDEPITPPAKRPLLTEEQHHRYLMQQQHQMAPPAAHIKVTSSHAQRETGLPLFELRGDNSLVVSIELNGVLYQGVLYPRGTPLHVLTSRAAGSSS